MSREKREISEIGSYGVEIVAQPNSQLNSQPVSLEIPRRQAFFAKFAYFAVLHMTGHRTPIPGYRIDKNGKQAWPTYGADVVRDWGDT